MGEILRRQQFNHRDQDYFMPRLMNSMYLLLPTSRRISLSPSRVLSASDCLSLPFSSSFHFSPSFLFSPSTPFPFFLLYPALSPLLLSLTFLLSLSLFLSLSLHFPHSFPFSPLLSLPLPFSLFSPPNSAVAHDPNAERREIVNLEINTALCYNML